MLREGIGLRGEPADTNLGSRSTPSAPPSSFSCSTPHRSAGAPVSTGKLSLQKLFFYTVPSTRTLNALDALRLEANFNWGALLNVLQRLSQWQQHRRPASDCGVSSIRAGSRAYFRNARKMALARRGRAVRRVQIAVDGTSSREDLTQNFNTKFWTGGTLFATSRSQCSFSARRARF